MSVASAPAEQQVLKIKRQAVLELYVRDGAFWKAVDQIRSKWEIVPIVGLPPKDLPVPAFSDDPDKQYWSLQLFRSDIDHLRLKIGRGRLFRASDWEKFVTACVFYDPPESNEGDDLLAFAEYGGINPALPVRRVLNQAQWQLQHQRYWEGIVDGLAERYEEATGEDPADVLDEIIREKRLEELLARPVDREAAIFPDEHTNEDELRAAYAQLRSNRGGRTSMNGLVAVVAAIKHDDHNHRDPQKRSERRYAYPKLAEALKDYGVRTNTRVAGSSAKKYVQLGRRLRAIRAENLENSSY
jgi:hypothetical protein